MTIYKGQNEDSSNHKVTGVTSLGSTATTNSRMHESASTTTVGSTRDKSDLGGKKSMSGTSLNTLATTSSRSSAVQSPDDREESEHLLRAIELDERVKTVNFKFVTDIATAYELLDDVFPADDGHISTTKRVCFGRRLGDKKTVIIKQRSKSKSFKDDTEIKDWVYTMKLLYSVTAGGLDHKKLLKPKNKEDNFVFDAEGKKYMNCSHMAKVLDILEDKKYYYCVMEYVRGRDFFEYFIQEKPHEKPYCLSLTRMLAKDMCIALDRMHSMGITHRDIKLENLVLDESEKKQEGPILNVVSKIIDFDTCETYRPGNKTLYVLGTDQYIAPESYAGYAGPTADMWALGVILYVFLTGTFPFHYKLFDDEVGENYVGHPRMDQIRRRLRIAKIDWSHQAFTTEPKAKDFVRRCFVTDQRRRITVKSALQHAWLKDS